jgi:superfamily I DNA and/or RNA helicase
MEIGTVDSFQGRERNIVILSCVRAEGSGALWLFRLAWQTC